MSKGVLLNKLEDMSVIEPVPYRPWCEGQEEGPVDFSIKNRKSSSTLGDTADMVRSQLFVRTPDSGFNSPSDGEYARKLSAMSSGEHHFSRLYSPDPSLHVEEQTAPLALVKKKTKEKSSRSSPLLGTELPMSPNKFSLSPVSEQMESQYQLSSSQASAFQLLSSSFYWPHSSTSITNSAQFSSLVNSAYDLSNGNFRKASENSSQNLKASPFAHSTPIKTPSKSPEESILSPIKRKTPSSSLTPDKKPKSLKKTKATRRLQFDEDKTSPVSGTIIRQLEEGEEPLVIRKGDIDPAYNVVEITEEAKEELSKIENKIGDYVCRLCKELYDDAFGLAQHRCSRIIHVEYRCPECDKVFNCPANLASHRRWHKPKGNNVLPSGVQKNSRSDLKSLDESSSDSKQFNSSSLSPSNNSLGTETSELISIGEMTSLSSSEESLREQFECMVCFKKFKKQSYLRKHLLTHNPNDSDGTEEHHQGFLNSFAARQRSLYSPQSPPLHTMAPLLSPPFSDNVFRCRLCSANFFTPAALQLHYSTIHDSDDHQSSSNLLTSALHLPMSHFSSKANLLSPPYSSYPLLSRPSQISAPS